MLSPTERTHHCSHRADTTTLLQLALSSQYDTYESNAVVQGCSGRAEFLGEALLHTLNEQAYPNADETQLQLCLTFICTLFADSATSSAFFSNDLRVLVDMVIRELNNLPPDDASRCDYLQVLRLVLEMSPWFPDGRYRREDILAVLQAILEAGEHDSPDAHAMTQGILFECAELLED